jgi:excisionase family DNA binding protein
MANVAEGRVLLTKAEVAERLRVSERTVDRWRRLGVIKAMLPLAGGAVRYRAEDVEALLEPEVRPILLALGYLHDVADDKFLLRQPNTAFTGNDPPAPGREGGRELEL